MAKEKTKEEANPILVSFWDCRNSLGGAKDELKKAYTKLVLLGEEGLARKIWHILEDTICIREELDNRRNAVYKELYDSKSEA